MTVFVLDDDPTGTQTVHDVPILTVWDVESLAAELAAGEKAVFLLTNSRALPAAEAEALNAEIGANLVAAGVKAGRPFAVVSRSDSTLRGHFPGEVEALRRGLGWQEVPILICPFFEAGGRITRGDTHYLRDGNLLTPVGETEFARDAAFGYRSSNLRDWVVEKSKGMISAERVHSLSLDDIREGSASSITGKLRALGPGDVGILNCETSDDLAVLVAGVIAAEKAGGRFLYRTAASFAAARAGIAPRPLLTAAELDLPQSGGGLIVVGSYVQKSSRQLEILLATAGITAIEVKVESLLMETQREAEIMRATAQVAEGLARNEDVVLFTSRRLITDSDPARSLAIGKRVSDALVAIVRALPSRPRYLLAKGGITSSDLATKAMAARRAMTLGPILPGVPVWRLGAESRFPGLAYIVFPGNVGGPEALAEVVRKLRILRSV